MEDSVCVQEAGLSKPRADGGCDSAQEGRSTVAARIKSRRATISAEFPTCWMWSLVAPASWSVVARLAVIPWSLVAQSNS
jgi:hypothetical protein